MRHEGDELDERQFLADCLALGRQYQLQQRIHSPESLAKPLYANALAAGHESGPGRVRRSRSAGAFLDEVRAAIRDLDVIEFLAMVRINSLVNREPASL